MDETTFWQAKIDLCSQAGGGVVCIPPGLHKIKTLFLRNFVELHLDNGAVLTSILTPSDMTTQKKADNMRFLLGGTNLRNVAITGFGTIDGNGHVFWKKDPCDSKNHYSWVPGRPKCMVHFKNCENIVIRDVTLCEPPTYTVWLLGCDSVTINAVRIRSDMRSPNTDGIDIDCCSNVSISDCDIIAGDDAIALKSSRWEVGSSKPCMNVTVTGCKLKSSYSGIRLGWEGDNPICNCIFSNNVIYDTHLGISLLVVVKEEDRIHEGTPIHDILFTDMIVNAIHTFQIQQGMISAGKMTGYIDRVQIRNILAEAKAGSYIGGTRENPIRELEVSNLKLRMSEDSEDCSANAGWTPPDSDRFNPKGIYALPWGITLNHIENLIWENFSFSATQKEKWLKGLQSYNIKNEK